MTRLIPLIAALGLAAGSASGMGLFGGSGDDKFAGCRTGSVGASDIGGPFELVDETGATVTDADVITGPTLLYFGYTFCPDVCPFDTVRNAEATDILEQRGIMLTPVFISVDSERDTPEQIAAFTSIIHDRMLGLTGSPEQIRAASQAYRTYYARNDSDDPDFYLIDHSTFSYLVFPEDGFVEYFRREVSPEEMADRIQCFVEAAS